MWAVDVVCGGPLCLTRLINDSNGRKWLVSATLRLKRRLYSHKACVGLHVKCASCLPDFSHSRLDCVGRYQLNSAVSVVTGVLVMGRDGCRVVADGQTDGRTDMT